MILGFQIFNTSTQELVWSRVYNSETLHSRFQAMAVDYKQIVHKDMEDSDDIFRHFELPLEPAPVLIETLVLVQPTKV